MPQCAVLLASLGLEAEPVELLGEVQEERLSILWLMLRKAVHTRLPQNIANGFAEPRVPFKQVFATLHLWIAGMGAARGSTA